TERRDGRDMSCDAVRGQLTGRFPRNRGVHAHVDSCLACQSFERTRRGRLLHSRCLWVLAFASERVRGFATRAAGLLGAGPDGSAIVGKPLVAGAAAAIALAGAHAAEHRSAPVKHHHAAAAVATIAPPARLAARARITEGVA